MLTIYKLINPSINHCEPWWSQEFQAPERKKTEERSNSARCWTETWSPAGDPGKQGFPWLLNGFNGVHMWIHGFFGCSWCFSWLFHGFELIWFSCSKLNAMYRLGMVDANHDMVTFYYWVCYMSWFLICLNLKYLHVHHFTHCLDKQ